MTTNYTNTDLAAVQAAIASGELVVRRGDKQIQYRSMDELLKAEQTIKSALTSASTGVRGGPRRFKFTTSRE